MPQVIKRLIYLGTAAMLSAATARFDRIVLTWLIGPEATADLLAGAGPINLWTIPIVLVAAYCVYDKLTRGRVRFVNLIGLPVFIVMPFLSSRISQTDWWLRTSFELFGT